VRKRFIFLTLNLPFMKYIFILFFTLLTQITFAQSPPHIQDAKRCNNWGMGYGNGSPTALTRTSLKIIPFQQRASSTEVKFWETNTHISDTLGNLLFYSNGIMIGDSTHHIMMGCDTLNPGYYASINRTDAGYEISQGILTLPFPNHTNLYYLFHTRIPNNTAYALAEGIYYTIVDMNGNNGLGEVVSLRNPIIQNSEFSPRITACRHANGRDWWIVIRALNTDAYATMLLSPQGVSSPVWHTALLPQNNYTASSFYSQSCFSPDGTKFAYHTALGNAGNYITLYDFDRCNGSMSNPRFGMVNDSTGEAGAAFSPNSKYLYFNTADRMFQVDVTNLIPFNHIDTVGVNDGFQYPIGFVQIRTFFARQQLGDDGKIYIRSIGTNHYMHTIEQPNIAGRACGFMQHNIRLLTANGFSLPLSPYFCLGPLDGSPCDTLGINNIDTTTTTHKAEADIKIKVFPNPASDYINIELSENIKANAYLYNALGQMMKQTNISNSPLREGLGEALQINTHDLANGIYFLIVLNVNKQRIGTKRIVVHHE
jgi:Secretion system C-terminal sorting domain